MLLLAMIVSACQQAAPAEPTAAAVEPTAAEPTAVVVEPTAAQVEPTAAPAEPTAPAAEATEAESGPITLSVWWISSSPEYADQISAIMKQYEAQNPDVTIEVTYFPYSDYVTAMGPALEAGDPPDLAFSDPLPPTLPNYIAAGHVMDLTDVAEEKGWRDRLTPGMLDFYRPVHEGGIYGPPLTPAVRGFFYNKKIMEEIGGKIPETVDELEALAKQAKEAGYIPFGLGNQTNWSAEYYWLNLTYANMASKDWEAFKEGTMNCEKGVSWSGPEIKQALEKFVEWEKAGYFNEGYNAVGETDVHLEFARGKMLTYFYSAQSQNSALMGDELDFEVGFFNFPAVTSGDHILAMSDPGNVLIVPTKSKHPDQAIALIDWLLQPEVGQMLAEAGILPAHNIDLAGTKLPVPWMSDELAALGQQIPYGWLNWTVPGLGDITGPEVQRVLAGEISADEALQSFQKTYDEACNQ
jgi:raffinose/stachyose/melibiose transport system substrate-binding protein